MQTGNVLLVDFRQLVKGTEFALTDLFDGKENCKQRETKNILSRCVSLCVCISFFSFFPLRVRCGDSLL